MLDGPPSPESQPELEATVTHPSAGSGLVLNQTLDIGLPITQQENQVQGSRARPYRMGHFVTFFWDKETTCLWTSSVAAAGLTSLTHSMEALLMWLPMAITVKFKVLV